jgi:hypothetical protein
VANFKITPLSVSGITLDNVFATDTMRTVTPFESGVSLGKFQGDSSPDAARTAHNQRVFKTGRPQLPYLV